jgi:hypothetical protein
MKKEKKQTKTKNVERLENRLLIHVCIGEDVSKL